MQLHAPLHVLQTLPADSLLQHGDSWLCCMRQLLMYGSSTVVLMMCLSNAMQSSMEHTLLFVTLPNMHQYIDGVECRSDAGAGAGGQGADATALLSQDAAGQKVKVVLKPVCTWQLLSMPATNMPAVQYGCC